MSEIPAGVTREQSKMDPSHLVIATWNQNGWSEPPFDLRVRELERVKVDVLCAQELTCARYEGFLAALQRGDDRWWGRFSLEVHPDAATRRQWGVAVFGRAPRVTPDDERSPFVLDGPRKDKEKHGLGLFWRRTLVVPVRTGRGQALDVASIHVRPGATVATQKMHFLDNVQHLFASPRETPLVVGVDTNSSGFYDEPNPEFFLDPGRDRERKLWTGDGHDLVDTWTGDPRAHTHVLRKGSGKGARFDQIWATRDLTVRRTDHVSVVKDGPLGTDHAMVWATLALP